MSRTDNGRMDEVTRRLVHSPIMAVTCIICGQPCYVGRSAAHMCLDCIGPGYHLLEQRSWDVKPGKPLTEDISVQEAMWAITNPDYDWRRLLVRGQGVSYSDAAYVRVLIAHRLVWAFRAVVKDTWPTPDTVDSLKFAVTEAAESLDAWIRANRDYARNRERLIGDDAMYNEIADYAMMLLTAIGPDRRPLQVDRVPPLTIDEMIWYAAELSVEVQHGLTHDLPIISGLLAGVSIYPGIALLPHLAGRLRRIYKKHGEPSYVPF